jgi:hypothetical protein
MRHAAAGSTLRRRCRHLSAAGYRVARVTQHLGRWIRTTDWYPDFQLVALRRRRGTGRAMFTRPPRIKRRPAARRTAAFLLSRHRRASRDHQPLHDRRRPADVEAGKRSGLMQCAPIAGGVSKLRPARFPRRHAGFIISAMNAYYAFLNRPLGNCNASSRHLAHLISCLLHIDTAQTWRGGQNQVSHGQRTP